MVENHDVEMYYIDGTNFTVKILDGHGNPLANATVNFNAMGYLFEVLTDSNGVASLPIELFPNEYIITAYYGNYAVSNKLVVKEALFTSDVNMRYLDGSAFKAKVLGYNGVPKANATVYVLIVGVILELTTGDDGIAILPIELPVGEYDIITAYGIYQKTNKIKVRS